MTQSNQKISASAIRLPPERRTFSDPRTGRKVVQWTQSQARDNHLYFTSPSVTADDRWLVVLSERFGDVNLFAVDRQEGGTLHQVSRNRRGTMRSYCWPRGSAFGLCKASPVLDAARNRLYYIQDETLFRADLDQPSRDPEALWTLPAGWWPAFTHISPDGATICIPLSPPQVFLPDLENQWQQMRSVPHAFAATGRRTRLYMIDTRTGAERIAAECPFWVTHVQFCPTDAGRLIFNCEGCWEVGQPRIWRLLGEGRFEPYLEDGEFRTHENWSPDGAFIVYHGHGRDGGFFAGRRWDGTLVFQHTVADLGAGHVTPTPNGRGFITDALEQCLTLFQLDDHGAFQRTTLCHHGWQNENATGIDQDDHVHPLTTPDGRSIIFSSNREGVSNVYEVEIGERGDPATATDRSVKT